MSKGAQSNYLSTSAEEENFIEANILEPHFDRFTVGSIEELIEGWKENRAKAIYCLCVVTNVDRDSVIPELCQWFSVKWDERSQELISNGGLDDPSLRSLKILDGISRHCSGNLQKTDPIWRQCGRFIDVTKVDATETMQARIGAYFKRKTDEHLEQTYKKEYSNIKTQMEASPTSSRTPSPEPKSPQYEAALSAKLGGAALDS